MNKLNQDGAVSGAAISLVICVLLLLGAIVFGAWAYSSRQDYKNNVDAKVNAAVGIAKQEESTQKDKQFAEEEKSPLKTYNGPEAFGSLDVSYPKTWSGYVDDSGNGSQPLDGYFNPGVVPSIGAQNSVFALRVQVLSQSYTQTLQTFQSASSSNGGPALTIVPYALPKVPKVIGVEATGTLPNTNNVVGTAVVLPLRSQTLEIWTMGTSYLNDFNTYILPNFSFSP
jgi:hypothetical protein